MRGLLKPVERLGLATNLGLGFLYLISIVILEALFCVSIDSLLNEQTRRLQERELGCILRLKDASLRISRVDRVVKQAFSPLASPNRGEITTQVQLCRSELEQDLIYIKQRVAYPENRQRLAAFEYSRDQLFENVAHTLLLMDKDPKAAWAFSESRDYLRPLEGCEKLLAEVTRSKEERSVEIADRVNRICQTSRMVNLIFLGLGLIGVPLGLVMARSIRQPYLHLRRVVEEMTEGQVNLRVPHTDYPNEIGQMARAIELLQHEASANSEQNWIKSIWWISLESFANSRA